MLEQPWSSSPLPMGEAGSIRRFLQERPVYLNKNNNYYYYCLCFREKLSTLQLLLTIDKIKWVKAQQKYLLCFLPEGLTHFHVENFMAHIQLDTAKAQGLRRRCAGQSHGYFPRRAAWEVTAWELQAWMGIKQLCSSMLPT